MPVTLMVVREPVLVTSQICKSWILSQTWIQRIHLMHFCESLISGNSLSQGNSSRRCLNGISMMFRSLARLCRVQLPLLTQVAHLQSCWERISCTVCLLAVRTFGLFVWITIPSFTTLLQEVTSRSIPSSSTTQTRQAAISLISFR